MQIHDLQHFELLDVLLQRADHSSHFLVLDFAHQHIDVLGLFQQFQQIGLAHLHLSVLGKHILEHGLYFCGQVEVADEEGGEFDGCFDILFGLERENALNRFFHFGIDKQL